MLFFIVFAHVFFVIEEIIYGYDRSGSKKIENQLVVFAFQLMMYFSSENNKEPLFWFVANRKFSKIEDKEKYDDLSEEDKEVVGQLGFWILIIYGILLTFLN